MADLSLTQFRLLTKRGSDTLGSERAGRVTSEQTHRLKMVWGPAMEVWKDEEHAVEFLTRRHPMLHDQRPIDVALQSDEGAQSVRDILGRLRFGSAA